VLYSDDEAAHHICRRIVLGLDSFWTELGPVTFRTVPIPFIFLDLSFSFGVGGGGGAREARSQMGSLPRACNVWFMFIN
jgi:hypothetical protein